MPALMIQGTGSNVGKSLFVAGLARAALRRGVRVAPFKPQNMSNNAAVTADGGEIGRAQALQAQACGLAPHTDMNPVLLKPESDRGSQVVVQGQVLATVQARDYTRFKPTLMTPVLESFHRLRAAHELVLVEGAGSPAEVNLRQNDIANMGFACAAGVPVILVGDIDRGGVIAQIVGTQAVLSDTDAAMVKGFIVNKFRGDPSLFDDGYAVISQRTRWAGFGVLPWFAQAGTLPAEDALDLRRPSSGGRLKAAVPMLSRIANFDDLDPLAQEPAVDLTMVPAGQAIAGDCDLIILPGTKNTRLDLDFVREQGWDIDIAAHVRRGGRVLGICGGYQILGRSVSDPTGLEGPAGTTPGLGLLNVQTTMLAEKHVRLVDAVHVASRQPVRGYEIHLGITEGPDRLRPFVAVQGSPEGAQSADGLVCGTYLHGLFTDDRFRAAFIAGLGGEPSKARYSERVEQTLDSLAEHIERHVDVTGLLRIAGCR
jgi:adenosylcobyric acid synthase